VRGAVSCFISEHDTPLARSEAFQMKYMFILYLFQVSGDSGNEPEFDSYRTDIGDHYAVSSDNRYRAWVI
jgi:hypothetical protein